MSGWSAGTTTQIDLGLWTVADGMAGMTTGEVASQAIFASPGAIQGPLDASSLQGRCVAASSP